MENIKNETNIANPAFFQRNDAIDIFRAITMFIMVFVNDFWKVSDIPPWLDHARRGATFIGLADYVLPCFLFVVGMSIPFAIERRYSKGASGESTIGHILSRTFALLVMGVFITNTENSSWERLSPEVFYNVGVYWILMVTAFIFIWNLYPRTDKLHLQKLFKILPFIGVGILLFLAITYRDINGNIFRARWGILGNIGWTYLVCAMIYVFSRDRLKYLIPAWCVFVFICILNSRMIEARGGAAILSMATPNIYSEFLGIFRIGNGSSCAFTMGGIILSLLCVKYAHISNRKKIIFAVVAFAVFLSASYLARYFWIMSKGSAAPPWIFYITATSIAVYSIIYWLVEKGKGSWFNIIKPAGTATLTCYCFPYVAYGLAHITGITLPDWFTHGFMSIVNCLCFAFVIVWATWLANKFYIKLKI
jgi:hypothetical protein